MVNVYHRANTTHSMRNKCTTRQTPVESEEMRQATV
jgi:hypothetical protein